MKIGNSEDSLLQSEPPVSFPEGKALDVICLGRLCIDLNANEIHRPLEETVTFTRYLGGSPANIAVAAARAGLKTGFIGKVSDDGFGRYIQNYMKSQGIDLRGVGIDRSGAVTGLAFTEIKSSTECSILMYRDNAADLKLRPEEIDESYIASARALILSGTALAQSPSREAVFRAVELAEKHSVKLILDIDYRPYSWLSKAEVNSYCGLVAKKCDIIFGGREEFDLLDNGENALGIDEITAERWLGNGAQLVIIKHGANGATVFDRNGGRWESGIYPAQVVKTFGAGDSFAGAFIYGLLQGWPIDRCLRYGKAAAHIVVSSHSCSDAMPSLAQMRDIIKQFEGEEAC